MMNTIKKIKKILCSNRGETLIESLISIIIFSLLIATITLTISTALRITSQTEIDASKAQERVNEIIAGKFNETTDTVSFTFTYETTNNEGDTIENDIEVSHEVYINEEENKKAFKPKMG